MAEKSKESSKGFLPVRSRNEPSPSDEVVLSEQVKEFHDQGYVVIRGLLNISEIVEVRDCLDVLISEKIKATLGHLEGNPISGEELAMLGRTVRIGGPADSALIGFPGLLTQAPEVVEHLIKPFLLNPALLDLAERVMDLLSKVTVFYVVGTPPTKLTGRKGGIPTRQELIAEAGGLHRDSYNHHNMWRNNPGYLDDLESGKQPFTPPLAARMLCYLQDMEGDQVGRYLRSQVHTDLPQAKSLLEEIKIQSQQLMPKQVTQYFFTATCCTLALRIALSMHGAIWLLLLLYALFYPIGTTLPNRLLLGHQQRRRSACIAFFSKDTADGGPLRREEQKQIAMIKKERG